MIAKSVFNNKFNFNSQINQIGYIITNAYDLFSMQINSQIQVLFCNIESLLQPSIKTYYTAINEDN